MFRRDDFEFISNISEPIYVEPSTAYSGKHYWAKTVFFPLGLMFGLGILLWSGTLPYIVMMAVLCLPLLTLVVFIQFLEKVFEDEDSDDFTGNSFKETEVVFICMDFLTKRFWLMSILMILGFVVAGALWL